ncbi:hypothetical protein JG687_00013282 [Phytophthora cactorum]|uniref:Uncharacterized protein n=1 Tax=Phytophthora cactorum TaxID=29920 RepID=A0A8T1U0S4_9STRA|nr:hypothetical protein JG687_00013282 [Phytophthora cactorum]
MQPRRDPSALDIACTLFGNNEAAQELAARMDVSRPHRNDISISSKLVALRRMMDEMFVNENECGTDPASETASISTLWLQALRALSKSSPNSANTFHSGTWQRRQMNTQIASFTQLRHDTVLYTTQKSSLKMSCEHPAGMVDPYPLFWKQMRTMALRMESIGEDAQALHRFSVGGGVSIH